VFFVTAALVFLSSVAATTYMCRSMAGGMPMPGGWTMSMPWMKMPEQTWPGAASFECSWLLSIGHLSAWQHGLKLGVHCTLCCASLMGVLLTLGIMDLRVMSLVGAAIALERITPWPVSAARVVGLCALALGMMIVARAPFPWRLIT
jgi:hypothetical protein